MATPFKIDGSHGQDQEDRVPSTGTPVSPESSATPPQPTAPIQPISSREASPSAEQRPGIESETPLTATQETTEVLPHAAAPASLSTKTQAEAGEKKSSKSLFWILVALLFVLILAVGGTTFYAQQQGTTIVGLFGGEEEEEDMREEQPPDGAQGAQGEEAEEESDEEEANGPGNEDKNGEEEETAIVGPNFTGEYVSATLPDEWTIVEYVDGNGSDILVDGVTYEGLTGLKIFDPNNTMVFALAAVYGIGGIEACSDYYEFTDSSLPYYQEVATAANEIGITPTITQIAADAYTEFTLFDLRIRRCGYTLYWDVNSTDPNSFDAACGMNAQIFMFNELQFSADGSSLGNYQFEISNNINEPDLPILDSVLESLEVIN